MWGNDSNANMHAAVSQDLPVCHQWVSVYFRSIGFFHKIKAIAWGEAVLPAALPVATHVTYREEKKETH